MCGYDVCVDEWVICVCGWVCMYVGMWMGDVCVGG